MCKLKRTAALFVLALLCSHACADIPMPPTPLQQVTKKAGGPTVVAGMALAVAAVGVGFFLLRRKRSAD